MARKRDPFELIKYKIYKSKESMINVNFTLSSALGTKATYVRSLLPYFVDDEQATLLEKDPERLYKVEAVYRKPASI